MNQNEIIINVGEMARVDGSIYLLLILSCTPQKAKQLHLDYSTDMVMECNSYMQNSINLGTINQLRPSRGVCEARLH